MPTRILECAASFNSAPVLGASQLPIVPRVLLEQAALTATGVAQNSAAVSSPNCRMVCVQSDEQIYVKIGAAPTATTNSYRLAAGGEQYFEAGVGDLVSIRT